MSVPILSSIFGEKPDIAPFKKIDFGASQLKSILANLKAFPQIQALGSYFQEYMTDAYNKAIPNFSKLLEMGGESAESILKAAEPLLHGEIPEDVKASIMRSGAFQALGKGGDFIHSLQARDLGRTSLDLLNVGANLVNAGGSATQKWAGLASGLIMNPAGELITPRDQANLDLQQSLIEREVQQAQNNVNAAPNPIAKGLSDLVAYLTASYIGHGPAGKPPDATNYSSAVGVGSQSYGTTAGGTEVFGPTSFQEIPGGGAGWDINAGPGNLQPPAETAGGPFGGVTGWNGSSSEWGGMYLDNSGNPYPTTTSLTGSGGVISGLGSSIGGPNAMAESSMAPSSLAQVMALLQGSSAFNQRSPSEYEWLNQGG